MAGTRARIPVESGCLSAALDYIRRGLSVVPVERGKRKPHVLWTKYQTRRPDRAEVNRWWLKWPTAQVGIVCGEVSGIVVLDVDPRNGGSESLTRLEKEYGPLPITVTVESGGNDRGFHCYFRYPKGKVLSGLMDYPGIDVQSDGQLAVVPPSVHHSSGRAYRFADGRSFDEVEIAPCPEWLMAKLDDDGARTRRKPVNALTQPKPITPVGRDAGDVVSSTDDPELAQILSLVPGLRRTSSTTFIGCCPFHEDEHPSFGLRCNPQAGKWRWRCFSDCDGSRLPWNGFHGGDVKDLEFLLGLGGSTGLRTLTGDAITDYIFYLDFLGRMLELDTIDEVRTAIAAMENAYRHRLDIRTTPAFASYRRLAEIDPGLDLVMPDNSLANRGRKIKRAIARLPEVGMVVTGTPRQGQARPTTTFSVRELISLLPEPPKVILTAEMLRGAEERADDGRLIGREGGDDDGE